MDYNICLHVNESAYEISVNSEDTLLEVIREKFNMTGTKDGCQLGECGACTVLLEGRPVNSCLVLAVEVDGCEVMTVEGLIGAANLGEKDTLHPLQKAFVAYGAVQCGFCTPGMLMSAKALLDESPNPTGIQIRQALRGNLCRCTGYKKIEQAIICTAEILEGEA